MLQEEGFLRGELNQRLRVAEWSPEELEAVFAERILLSVLCTRMTVSNLTDSDIDQMRLLTRQVESARIAVDRDQLRDADVLFHEMHMKGASTTLRADLGRLYERASIFRSMWIRNGAEVLSYSPGEHPTILEACEQRDADAAGQAIALHLTRVALTLLAWLAPDREPTAIRQALRLAGQENVGIETAVRSRGQRPAIVQPK